MSAPRNVQLQLASVADAHVIQNLWPLYQHEISEFDGGRPNRHGIFGAADEVTTLAQSADSMNPWFNEPQALFPYLILVDGEPAGFNLIAARSRLPEGIDADFVVHEFFLLHAYRGQGIGERAGAEGFDRHRGQWEIVTYPSHARAIAFWRKAVDSCSEGTFRQLEADHVWGRKVIFRFTNS